MAWGWSHTPEAYAYARERFMALPSDELRTIAIEWKALELAGKGAEEHEVSLGHFTMAERMTLKGERFKAFAEPIAEALWKRIEGLALSDNGGFNAWTCPYGCHTVPFGPEE